MKHPQKKKKHKLDEPMKDLDKLKKGDAQKPFTHKRNSQARAVAKSKGKDADL